MDEIKNLGGRPSKYLEHTPEEWKRLIREYINSCQDEHYTLIKTEGDKSTSWENKIRVKLPTIEGLSLFLGLAKDRIYEYAEHAQEFRDALEEILTEQKNRLIFSGLSGDYNPTIAKLLLSANHGMAEKTENKTDVTSKGERINDLRDLSTAELAKLAS